MPEHPRIVKVVMPAAGFGTIMLHATKVIPKEMLPVAGMPLIQYAVEESAASESRRRFWSYETTNL
jgi:UTP--glucose-1-phosphate uridylyltransferase